MEGFVFAAGVIILFTLLALIVEAVVEFIKPALPFSIPEWGDRLLAIVVGLVLAFQYQVDMPAVLMSEVSGNTYPISIIGLVLTGILISRGANALHDKLFKPVVS